MGRKFYGFGSPATVEKHVAQVKTVDDVWQLRHDIVASTTNRARFTGIERMWAIDYAPEGSGEFCRHIFIARTWVKEWACAFAHLDGDTELTGAAMDSRGDRGLGIAPA